MKITATIILILILLAFIYLASLGLFDEVKLEEKQTGPFTVVYEEHIGPYQETGTVQDKIYYKLLNEEKIETFKGFGIYYDNPKEVAAEELRSEVGSILEEKDLDKIDVLKEKGYQIKTIETQHSIVATFPFKNKLSIMLGIMKVYPAMEKHIQANNYQPTPSMEIYDVPNKQIIYIFEIKK